VHRALSRLTAPRTSGAERRAHPRDGSKVLDLALDEGEGRIDKEGQGEQNDEQGPHVLHQEVRGIDFEQ
jgi:hypothetical protein